MLVLAGLGLILFLANLIIGTYADHLVNTHLLRKDSEGSLAPDRAFFLGFVVTAIICGWFSLIVH